MGFLEIGRGQKVSQSKQKTNYLKTNQKPSPCLSLSHLMQIVFLCLFILILSSAVVEVQFCVAVELLRELPNLTIQEILCQSDSRGQRISLLGLKLFPEGRSSAPLDSPHTPFSHDQARFPYQTNPTLPRSESRMSCSIKQFIHNAVTRKQPQLVPLRRDPQKRTPGLLYLSLRALKSPSSSEFLLRLCPSVSIYPAGTTLLVPFVNKRVGSSQPLVSLGFPECSACISICISVCSWKHAICSSSVFLKKNVPCQPTEGINCQDKAEMYIIPEWQYYFLINNFIVTLESQAKIWTGKQFLHTFKPLH